MQNQKRIWHMASEIPEFYREIVVIHKRKRKFNGNIDIGNVAESYLGGVGYFSRTFSLTNKRWVWNKIKRWAYADELYESICWKKEFSK